MAITKSFDVSKFRKSITKSINGGAGKSYICFGNIIKNAQEQGIFVVLIDTENALDEDWLKALGVDSNKIFTELYKLK
jgi:RecA/RadA recombinase